MKSPRFAAWGSSGVFHLSRVNGVVGLLFLSVMSRDGGEREIWERWNSRPGTASVVVVVEEEEDMAVVEDGALK